MESANQAPTEVFTSPAYKYTLDEPSFPLASNLPQSDQDLVATAAPAEGAHVPMATIPNPDSHISTLPYAAGSSTKVPLGPVHQAKLWEQPSHESDNATAPSIPDLNVITPSSTAMPGAFPKDEMFSERDIGRTNAAKPISSYDDTPETEMEGASISEVVNSAALATKQGLEAAASSIIQTARRLSRDLSVSLSENPHRDPTERSTSPISQRLADIVAAASISGADLLNRGINNASEQSNNVAARSTEICNAAVASGSEVAGSLGTQAQSAVQSAAETSKSVYDNMDTSNKFNQVSDSVSTTASNALNQTEGAIINTVDAIIDGATALTNSSAVAAASLATSTALSAEVIKNATVSALTGGSESEVPTQSLSGRPLPEYQGGAIDVDLPVTENHLDDIIYATEEERRRRNQPGSTGQQAMAHANAEAIAFIEGMRQQLGESSDIPALAVPRKSLIRDATESERELQESSADLHKQLGADQARLIKEGLAGAAAGEAIKIARREAHKASEESERDERVLHTDEDMTKAAALSAALLSGLSSTNSPAANTAKAQHSKQLEENERDLRTSIPAQDAMEKSESLANLVCAGLSAPNHSKAADVAREQLMRDAVEDERSERVQDSFDLEPLAHRQASLIANAIENGIDLNHVSSNPELLKKSSDLEEAERKYRMEHIPEQLGKERSPSATAFAVGVIDSMHNQTGEKVVKIPVREIQKMQIEREQEHQIENEVPHDSAHPIAQSLEAGLASTIGNDAIDVARHNSTREVGNTAPFNALNGADMSTNTHSTSHFNENKNANVDQEAIPPKIAVQNWGAHGSPESDEANLPKALPSVTSIRDGKITPPSTPVYGSGTTSGIDSDAVAKSLGQPPRSESPDSSNIGLETIRPNAAEENRNIESSSTPSTLSVPDSHNRGRRASQDSTNSNHSNHFNPDKPSKAHAVLNKSIGRVEEKLGKLFKKDSLTESGMLRLDAAQQEKELIRRRSVSREE